MKRFLTICFAFTMVLNGFSACSDATTQESTVSLSSIETSSSVEEVPATESEEDQTLKPWLPNVGLLLSYRNGNTEITALEQLKTKANHTESDSAASLTRGEFKGVYAQFLFGEYVGGTIAPWYDVPTAEAIGFLYHPMTEEFYLVGETNGIDVLSNHKIGFEIYRDDENPLLKKYSLVNQVTDQEYGYILLDKNLEVSPVQLELDLQEISEKRSSSIRGGYAVRILGAEYCETTKEYILFYLLWLNPEAGGGDIKITQVYMAYYDEMGSPISTSPLDKPGQYHYVFGPHAIALQWVDGRLLVYCETKPQQPGANMFFIDPVLRTSQVVLASSEWYPLAQEEKDAYPGHIDGDAWLEEHPEYRYMIEYQLLFALDGVKLKEGEPPVKVVRGEGESIDVIDAATGASLCTLTNDHYLVDWQYGENGDYTALFGFYRFDGGRRPENVNQESLQRIQELARLWLLYNRGWDFRSAKNLE